MLCVPALSPRNHLALLCKCSSRVAGRPWIQQLESSLLRWGSVGQRTHSISRACEVWSKTLTHPHTPTCALHPSQQLARHSSQPLLCEVSLTHLTPYTSLGDATPHTPYLIWRHTSRHAAYTQPKPIRGIHAIQFPARQFVVFIFFQSLHKILAS